MTCDIYFVDQYVQWKNSALQPSRLESSSIVVYAAHQPYAYPLRTKQQRNQDDLQQGFAPLQQSGFACPVGPLQNSPPCRQFVGKIWLDAVIVDVQPPVPVAVVIELIEVTIGVEVTAVGDELEVGFLAMLLIEVEAGDTGDEVTDVTTVVPMFVAVPREGVALQVLT